METWKKDVIEVYLETSFKEYILPATEKSIMDMYNKDEETEHEVVLYFFDLLDITEEEFLEISENFN